MADRFYAGEQIPWLLLTEVVVWIFLVLTLLVMIKKPAYLSLTVIALAIYVLHNTRHIGRSTFRGLVALLALSWVYDAIWLLIIEPGAADEDLEDGGNEWKLRRFVKLMSYITLFFKVIVVLVFWKDSLDFRNIVRKRAGQQEEGENIDFIVAQYQNNI